MAIKAITIDLYGTLVKDNNVLMRDICQRINASSRVFESTAASVGKEWLALSVECAGICIGDKFLNEKELEIVILTRLLNKFRSRLDPYLLQEEIRNMSLRPTIYDDARLFLTRLPLPCYVLCNGDRKNIETAVDFAGLNVEGIICSEDAKAYKPNYKIYEYALDAINLGPSQVLHVGDSINHDIVPAKKAGMKAILINRFGQQVPADLNCDMVCSSLLTLRSIIK
ncbi:MAG: HAD family hydrolase [Eubacteriales bacterium]